MSNQTLTYPVLFSLSLKKFTKKNDALIIGSAVGIGKN